MSGIFEMSGISGISTMILLDMLSSIAYISANISSSSSSSSSFFPLINAMNPLFAVMLDSFQPTAVVFLRLEQWTTDIASITHATTGSTS